MNGMNRREAPVSLSWREAVAAWREVLGADRVISEGEALLAAETATFATVPQLSAILEPSDREETAECLRIAGRFGIPVHPVSGGRNWGYGSRVPYRDGAVLLSLARMDRILDFREDLACVTIEPGVTFRRLAAYLAERGSSLLPPVAGSTPDASVIGNILERGIGKGLYENMAAHGCGYEVVLANGETLTCGMAGMPGSRAGELHADGPGPSLQGLFLQSRLGVVTRMTVWLHPAPALQQNVMFPVPHNQALAEVIDTLRPHLLRGDPLVQAEIINDYRLLAMNRTFPFESREAASALSSREVAAMLGAAGPSRWYGCVRLWGDDEQELEWRRTRWTRALQQSGAAFWTGAVAGGLSVEYSAVGLSPAYWRKPSGLPSQPDPDRDRCGVIWLAPVLPMVGSEAVSALETAERIMLEAGFEPSVSLRLIGGRSILAVIGIIYDRDVPAADGRASRCYAALRDVLDRDGFYPYRTGLLDAGRPSGRSPGTESFLLAVRQVLDPVGVLC